MQAKGRRRALAALTGLGVATLPERFSREIFPAKFPANAFRKCLLGKMAPKSLRSPERLRARAPLSGFARPRPGPSRRSFKCTTRRCGGGRRRTSPASRRGETCLRPQSTCSCPPCTRNSRTLPPRFPLPFPSSRPRHPFPSRPPRLGRALPWAAAGPAPFPVLF